jgi:hypothetical protein
MRRPIMPSFYHHVLKMEAEKLPYEAVANPGHLVTLFRDADI